MFFIKVLATTFAALSLSGAGLAQTAPPLPSMLLEAESKVVWGVFIKPAMPTAFDYLAEWVKQKTAFSRGQNPFDVLAANATLASIQNLGSFTAGKGIVLAGAEPNAGPGDPGEALRVDGRGENYQGVNVGLVDMDDKGKILGHRPLAGGFTSGERFKLRVLSTFDAVVVLGNINSTGSSRQIYPAKMGYAVSIPAGKDILLPLGEREYFRFTGDGEHEQITFTVRDPRSLGAGHASTAKVFRKDGSFGSHFVQLVTPDRFPVIAGSFALKHRPAATP